MDTSDRVELRPGMEVVSLDDHKLGKVVSVNDAQLTVEKGFFFPHDHVIPMRAVESADDHTIYLNLSKDDALNQRGSAAATAGETGELSAYDDPWSSDVAAHAASGETTTIPVHEEELTATTRPVEAGHVEINKQVVSEDRTLEVPITEERVRVTRRAVDRDASGADGAFAGGTIHVPVQTEAVDLQKRVRVAEEVEIAREAVQKTRQVSGTVRHGAARGGRCPGPHPRGCSWGNEQSGRRWEKPIVSSVSDRIDVLGFERAPSTPVSAEIHGFGVAWDPAWIDPDRLVVHGYRAWNAHDVIARWDIDALIATVEDALEGASWPEIDRRAAVAAIRQLYASELA